MASRVQTSKQVVLNEAEKRRKKGFNHGRRKVMRLLTYSTCTALGSKAHDRMQACIRLARSLRENHTFNAGSTDARVHLRERPLVPDGASTYPIPSARWLTRKLSLMRTSLSQPCLPLPTLPCGLFLAQCCSRSSLLVVTLYHHGLRTERQCRLNRGHQGSAALPFRRNLTPPGVCRGGVALRGSGRCSL